MFSKLVKRTSFLYNFSTKNFSTKQAGSLYTWGDNSAGLGIGTVPSMNSKCRNPNKVAEFDNNVIKVSMGPHHTAVVTSDGNLWTFGYDEYGCLGQNISGGVKLNPTKVSFFESNKLRVVDVACGKDHTVALTENGEVFTWGDGGKRGFLKEWINPTPGGLGLGNTNHASAPSSVESLKDKAPVKSVAAGSDFTLALNAENEVFCWGNGEHGVFGIDHYIHFKVPTLNETIQELCHHEHFKLTKLRACDHSILALFDNGTLWGWGCNNQGQLGVGHKIGVEQLDINVDHPEKLHGFDNKKVKDFCLGDNIAIVLTEDGEAYYMGLRLQWEPRRLTAPNGQKVKRVGAAHGSVALVTENNEVYVMNEFVPENVPDFNTGLAYVSKTLFGNGEVLAIGGGYGNKYAIVRN